MKTHSGYVAILGRPNVGKSTLLNALVGQKISIISHKPQTTRHQILGITTKGSTQIVYIDTPGIHHVEKRAMSRYLNRLASSVLGDVNLIIFVVETTYWTDEDELVFNKIKETKKPIILVINKIDKLPDKKMLLPLIEKYQAKFAFAHIVPLSAKKAHSVQGLEKLVMEYMPENPHFFPEDQVTDRNEYFQVAEIIREKLIQMTNQELPYSTTVIIDSMQLKNNLLEIHATIWVEREGQKPIVIGKNGARLKKIGTAARKDIVALLGQKVFLQLWVKVKSNWTDDVKVMNHFGYS